MRTGLILLILLLLIVPVAAQEVVVPDVTGLSVPAAAAALNRLGLKLGVEVGEGWTAESGLPENSVRGQSPEAGQLTAYGAAVDITVLRSPNAALIYDDNDLSLLNRTGAELDLAGITFSSSDGTLNFAASRWAGILRDTQCVQVWSVGRNGPKALDDCSTIQNWMVIPNQPEQHFWTGRNGVTAFNIFQNGVLRASCPVANPGRCDFYLTSAVGGGDSTEYVYFAYTPDRLAVINRSTDQWMVLRGLTVYNNNPTLQQPGAPIPMGDPVLYPLVLNPVASVEQLAPGQCVLFTNSSPTRESPPQDCEVIARLDVDPTLIFWGADFETESQTQNRRYNCAAATEGRLTICVMPR